jgi:hypoxanthine-guanine phosphoribosyltransferase
MACREMAQQYCVKESICEAISVAFSYVAKHMIQLMTSLCIMSGSFVFATWLTNAILIASSVLPRQHFGYLAP